MRCEMRDINEYHSTNFCIINNDFLFHNPISQYPNIPHPEKPQQHFLN